MMNGGDGMGGGILMMLAMVVLVVLVIVGVVWLIRGLDRARDAAHQDTPAPDSALQVLERRFAAGEIDADEYRTRRSELVERNR